MNTAVKSFITIVRFRKLRFEELKWLAWGLTVTTGRIWTCFYPNHIFFTLLHSFSADTQTGGTKIQIHFDSTKDVRTKGACRVWMCVLRDTWWFLTHSAYNDPWPVPDYFGGLLFSVTSKSIDQETCIKCRLCKRPYRYNCQIKYSVNMSTSKYFNKTYFETLHCSSEVQI